MINSILIVLFWAVCAVVGALSTFSYTGNTQTYVVPVGRIKLNIIACGAKGSDTGSTYVAGDGGCITCTVDVTSGETLYVMVGNTLGWNGGGSGNSGGNVCNGGGISNV